MIELTDALLFRRLTCFFASCSMTISGWVFMVAVGFNAAAR
jgi:hypothetical protein